MKIGGLWVFGQGVCQSRILKIIQGNLPYDKYQRIINKIQV